MNRIIRYFDLNERLRSRFDEGASDGAKTLSWQWQYLALLAGIIIQPYFAHFQQHKVWVFDALPGWVLFSAIVGLVTFPAVYKSSFDPSKPMAIQVIPIFTAGLGWQSLFTTAMNAAGK